MPYECIVIEWIDGDSATVDISLNFNDLGFTIKVQREIRVYGIDAPECRSKNQEEKKSGLAAKEFANKIAPAGTKITIKPKLTKKGKVKKDKYGRYLAIVTLIDGSDFAAKMIESGHAVTEKQI